MDPWQLVKDGRFAEAVDAYTTALADAPTLFNYRNRATAYLNLGEFDLARADFEAAEEVSEYPGDCNLQSIGVAHWLAGRVSDAVAHWKLAVQLLDNQKLKYTDAAGGVESPCLLWFAGARSSDTELLNLAQSSLKNALKSGRATCFPAAIGQLLLRRTDAQSARKTVSSVPIRRERDLCKLEFYIAAQALHDGRPAAYINGLRECVKLTAALLENELYLARHELPRAEAEYCG